MDCQSVHKFLQIYLDGEFDEDDCRDVEQHLSGCATCRSQADYERRFREAIRARIPKPTAPPEFRQRLTELVEAGPVPRRLPRSLMWGSVPAVAALALVITFTWTVTSGFSPLVDEAVAKHSSAPPVEVTSHDSEEVERWFSTKVNFRVALPRFSGPQFDLEGARLSNLAERQAALIRYRSASRRFSLFVITDRDVELGGQKCQKIHKREFCLSELRGYAVVSWRSRGLVYSMVGETTPDELLQVLAETPRE